VGKMSENTVRISFSCDPMSYMMSAEFYIFMNFSYIPNKKERDTRNGT
jgi:hypothetical protein